MAYYLYALCHTDATVEPFPSWPRGVNPEGRILFVCSGPLAGLVQAVSLAEFGAKALKQNLQQADWIEAKVRAHDEMIRYLFERVDALVPVRFGAIFRTQERIKTLLDEGAETILADLARLHAAAEWSVKVFADQKTLLETAAGTPGKAQNPDRGMAYLRRIQQQEKLARQVKEWLREQVADCHQSLVELSREYRVNPCPGDGNGEHMVLNAVYLVPRCNHGECLRELERIAAGWAGSGLRPAFSGPWPPYSFATPVTKQDQTDG